MNEDMKKRAPTTPDSKEDLQLKHRQEWLRSVATQQENMRRLTVRNVLPSNPNREFTFRSEAEMKEFLESLTPEALLRAKFTL